MHVHPAHTTVARRPRLLIVGCGDVGLRVLAQLTPRWRVYALTSSPERFDELRQRGATPLLGNLDEPATLARLAHLAPHVLHLAPPPGQGDTDPRSLHLVRALARGGVARHFVYASTSGVYGDAQGQWITETRRVSPQSSRAVRRVDAEQVVKRFGRVHGVNVCVLRVPGIYAADRVGGNPMERVRQGAPVLVPAQDVYTNRIHADDLARACVVALMRGAPQRTYHVSDDTNMRMGDCMDWLADSVGLPRAPRITWAQAQATLSPMTLSFWAESRRLSNERLKRELRVRLRYPTLASAALR